MPKPVGNGLVRRFLAFGPASLRQWGEWVGVTVVIGGAAALAWFGSDLSGWQRVAGWSALGLALAYLMRSGLVRLFGPVLFYDLVRNARRARTYVTRCGYLALLLIFLWSVVGSQVERHSYPKYDRNAFGENTVDPSEMAALAESFFATFMAVQFGLAICLTPAYVAGAISEEKERKTLEFLLATDLDSREIVLGKLVARLGHLTLLLLTGLPVLSAVQFLGGVDPGLVLAGFAATALTVSSLAGLSILASVYVRRSLNAIVLTYASAGVYCGLCLLGSFVIESGYFPNIRPFEDGPGLFDCIAAFQAGNPGYALYELFSGRNGLVQTALPSVLRSYATFHVLLTAVTVTLAVSRLRPVALRESGGPAKGRTRTRATRSVGDRPMVWKELHYDGGMRSDRWGRLFFWIVVILSLLPIAFILLHTLTGYSGGWDLHEVIAREFNEYARVVGTMAACACLIGIAAMGSVAVRIERDKDTLDALLTSPLTTREILFGKWLGCLWCLRRVAVWLGAIYVPTVIVGGVSLLALPLLAGAILVYSGTLAIVGLWCSVMCRTTVRAVVAAVFAALALGVGHWLIWLCCLPFANGPGHDMEPVFKLQAGITPPVVLAILPFGPNEMMRGSEEREMFVYCSVGTVAWAALGFLVWVATNDQFQSMTNRADVLRPTGPDPGPGRRPATNDADA